MEWYRTISLALRTLLRNPLRSFLMMLGVTVGIAALTTMASVGEATKQETMRRFKRMVGTYDIVNIAPGAARTRGMPSLTTVEPTLKFDDATAIAAEARTITQVAQVQNAFDIDVKHRDNTSASAIYGISANWLESVKAESHLELVLPAVIAHTRYDRHVHIDPHKHSIVTTNRLFLQHQLQHSTPNHTHLCHKVCHSQANEVHNLTL